MPSAPVQTVEVDGRRLRVSNLEKVLYPETGTTKADVIAYYTAIAPALIPYAANRPLTRKRWPNGVGTERDPLKAFFEKDLGAGVPDWVQRRPVQHSSGTKVYPLVEDRATLAWLAQAAALELHVPQWQFARDGSERNPDRIVLDFDPGPGVDLPTTAQVALIAKDILDGMGLTPYPVTSGSKGIHVYAALDGSLTSDQVSAVAHELARALEADHPDLIVSDMKKALRDGKVLIDWSQNNAKKTTIAPYSLRGRPHPTVAAPRTWDELADPDLAHLSYREALDRYQRDGDLLAPLLRSRDAGLEPTPEHMATFVDHAGRGRPLGEVPGDAGCGEDAGTGARRSRHAGQRPVVRDPGAPRPATALRLPARARRRAGVVGDPERAADGPDGEPPRRADRGPSARVRHLRGRDPEGRIRGGHRHDLGRRGVRRGEVARREGSDRDPPRPAGRGPRRPAEEVRPHPHRAGRRREELDDPPDGRPAGEAAPSDAGGAGRRPG